MPEFSPLDNSESDEESDSEEANPEDNETVHKYSIPGFRLLKPVCLFRRSGRSMEWRLECRIDSR